MATNEVFSFKDYKEYLQARLSTEGEQRGLRSKLAQHLNCQTAFVSQVLNGLTHFTLENAALVNTFLKHNSEESHFFLLLVGHARSGARELRTYYEQQLAAVLEKRKLIAERIQVKTGLDEKGQMKYYSSWIYAAAHIALSIPEYQSPTALAKRLNLSPDSANDVITFLKSAGLAEQDGNKLKIGTTRIHLGKTSPMLPKHHANWRVRTLHALDQDAKDDLHYTLVASLSKDDRRKISEMILSLVGKTEPILRDSKEEQLVCLAFDFFEI